MADYTWLIVGGVVLAFFFLPIFPDNINIQGHPRITGWDYFSQEFLVKPNIGRFTTAVQSLKKPGA